MTNKKLKILTDNFLSDRIINVPKEKLNKELFFFSCNPLMIDYALYLKKNNINSEEVNSSVYYLLGLSNNYDKNLAYGYTEVNLPDVDIDVERRNDLIDYAINEVGNSNAVQLKTYSFYKIKSSIQAVLRFLFPEKKKQEIDKISKLFVGDNIDEILDSARKNQDLEFIYKKNKNFNQLVKNIYLKPNTSSQHPAGLILSERSILESTSYSLEGGYFYAQSPFQVLEKNAYIKLDFLPLTTLNQIKIAINLIKNQNSDFDHHKINFNDENVFEEFLNLKTDYIFQFSSKIFKHYLSRIHSIKNLEQLAILCAVLRRGPLLMGLHNDYLNNLEKKQENSLYKSFPKLKNILEETAGVLVYQEQIMRIVQEIAQFSKYFSVKIIKVLSKKESNKLDKYKKIFLESLKKQNFNTKDSSDLWTMLESFGEYGFNKAHAISYAKFAYMSMYLQYYYPKEWVYSLFKTESNPMSVYKTFYSSGQIESKSGSNEMEINKKLVISSKDLGLGDKIPNNFQELNEYEFDLEYLNQLHFLNFSFLNKFSFYLETDDIELYNKSIKNIKEKNIKFDTMKFNGISYILSTDSIPNFNKIQEAEKYYYLLLKSYLLNCKNEGIQAEESILYSFKNYRKNFELNKRIFFNNNFNFQEILNNDIIETELDKEYTIKAYLKNIQSVKGKKGTYLKLELLTDRYPFYVNVFKQEDFSKIIKQNKDIIKITLKNVQWKDITLKNYVRLA